MSTQKLKRNSTTREVKVYVKKEKYENYSKVSLNGNEVRTDRTGLKEL